MSTGGVNVIKIDSQNKYYISMSKVGLCETCRYYGVCEDDLVRRTRIPKKPDDTFFNQPPPPHKITQDHCTFLPPLSYSHFSVFSKYLLRVSISKETAQVKTFSPTAEKIVLRYYFMSNSLVRYVGGRG